MLPQEQVTASSSALSKANARIVALQEAASSATSRAADAHTDHSRRVAALEEALRAAQQDVRVKEQLYQAALAGKREVESQSEAVTSDASKRLDQYQVSACRPRGVRSAACRWCATYPRVDATATGCPCCACTKAKHQALRQQLAASESKAAAAEGHATRLAQQLQRTERQLQQTQSLLMVVREQNEQLQVRHALAPGVVLGGGGVRVSRPAVPLPCL